LCKTMIKRDKMTLNLRETAREKHEDWTGVYSHIVEDKIYYRLNGPPAICYAIREGDNYVKPQENTVMINSLAVDNFRVFLDKNPDTPAEEKYKAIGGVHVGKTHPALSDCTVSKQSVEIQKNCPVWPKVKRMIFKDDFFHPRHANGFYIFKSKNGIDWTLYHETPVLSAFTICEEKEQLLAGDSMPSIFYDCNIGEYVIYLRCNIKLGVRHVFYTKSKDLINWDAPRLISKNPVFDFEHENLYFMGAYPFPNSKKYISFAHHFKNEILSIDGSRRRYYDRKTKVMVSENGLHWEEVGLMFSDDKESWKVESGTRGCSDSFATHLGPPHVVSFREEGGLCALYVLEGIRNSDTKLVRYTIDKKELDAIVL
jgi:hypothetical protein